MYASLGPRRRRVKRAATPRASAWRGARRAAGPPALLDAVRLLVRQVEEVDEPCPAGREGVVGESGDRVVAAPGVRLRLRRERPHEASAARVLPGRDGREHLQPRAVGVADLTAHGVAAAPLGPPDELEELVLEAPEALAVGSRLEAEAHEARRRAVEGGR